MKISFDSRVLQHPYFTGVENYTKAILEHLTQVMEVITLVSNTKNKFIAHLYLHCIVPFRQEKLLFCPANIAPLYIFKKKKLVITIHDMAFMTYPQSFSPLFRYYYRFVMPSVIKRADAIITISNSSKREILNYFPKVEEKLEVIPLGVESVFSVDVNIEKKRQILYVGSLNERKNFRAVLEAFSLLEIDCQLIMVGSMSKNFTLDSKSSQVLNAAKKNNRIIFKEHIERTELIALYNTATLLIFPSFYEGFGLPPLEAMACGTPVITSNISSMPEVCGDAALYVDPYSIKDIALKIELLFYDELLQQEMIAKGHLHVKQFSWEKAALKHKKLFEQVLQR